MNDPNAFIHWARAEQERLSAEAMRKREQMEAVLNRMNLELGEFNGQMKMLDTLIRQAETGQMAGQETAKGTMDDSQLPHAPTAALDTDQQRVEQPTG